MVHYTLSEEQALAILDTKLQRLTSLEQNKIKEEYDNLLKLIKELTEILQDPLKIYNIIKCLLPFYLWRTMGKNWWKGIYFSCKMARSWWEKNRFEIGKAGRRDGENY